MRTVRFNTEVTFGDLATWALQGMLAGIFLADGIVQLVGIRAEVLLFEEIGLGQWLRMLAGIIQVAAAAALVSPRAASLAGAVLAALMAAATIAAFTVLPINPMPLISLGVLSAIIAFLRRDTLILPPRPIAGPPLRAASQSH